MLGVFIVEKITLCQGVDQILWFLKKLDKNVPFFEIYFSVKSKLWAKIYRCTELKFRFLEFSDHLQSRKVKNEHLNSIFFVGA